MTNLTHILFDIELVSHFKLNCTYSIKFEKKENQKQNKTKKKNLMDS